MLVECWAAESEPESASGFCLGYCAESAHSMYVGPSLPRPPQAYMIACTVRSPRLDRRNNNNSKSQTQLG